MNVRFAGILGLMALAACETTQQPLPQGVTNADVALFKAAVADAGCTIENEAQAAPVEARTGFDDNKLRRITEYLMLTQDVMITQRGIKLTTGPCADA